MECHTFGAGISFHIAKNEKNLEINFHLQHHQVKALSRPRQSELDKEVAADQREGEKEWMGQPKKPSSWMLFRSKSHTIIKNIDILSICV